jgi:hypothetical protein
MEIEESVVDPEEELDMIVQQDEELSNLPEEWTYTCSEAQKGDRTVAQSTEVTISDQIMMGDNGKGITEEDEVRTQKTSGADDDKENKIPDVKKRNQKWGPMIPERKSKRQPQGGISILVKAQALKKKNNLEVPAGKTHIPTLNNSSLVDIASKVGIDVESNMDLDSGRAQDILNLEACRKKTFRDICKVTTCSHKTDSEELPSAIQVGNGEPSNAQIKYLVQNTVRQVFEKGESSVANRVTENLEEVQGDEPNTPIVYSRDNIDLVEDLVDLTWTKVVDRKKSKKKLK